MCGLLHPLSREGERAQPIVVEARQHQLHFRQVAEGYVRTRTIPVELTQ